MNAPDAPSAHPSHPSPRPGSDIAIALADHVAVVEIRRPPNNFFDYELIRDLADLYEELDADPDCRAIVLCSKGRHFCAGADFSAREKWSRERMDEQAAKVYVEAVRVFSATRPVIAAVQGAAVGGGLGLALSADFRIACERSRFVANFAQLGIHQGFGTSVTLPRLVGHSMAARMLYTGARIKGEEALRIGLADAFVESCEVRSKALELAKEIASAAPLAVASIRTTLRQGLADAVRKATDRELAEQSRLRRTEDHLEGVRAMAERRPGDFKGR
ncbi:MAG: enoyl-CoA hydratase/isomerase family protein [Ectothiorhodospiraceae bacterium AqS1]|nr:enoyl-CoA hydratase/isomerase family protein [Ectothiorhodospiraceae bacterium AqS1]